MKKNYTINLVLALIMCFTFFKTNAQCVYGSQFGSSNVNGGSGALTTITGCNYAGEFSVNTFTNIGTYVFSSSVGGDILTLTDASNNVIAFGVTPLTAFVPTTGVYRLHVALAGCATQNSCRTTSIQKSALNTIVYNYTGTIRTFTIPTCVSTMTIETRGAQGGFYNGGTGGYGARMIGTFGVTPGQVLYILAGQCPGEASLGGYYYPSGGGGSFVGSGASLLTATPMIVSGGGGGGNAVSGNNAPTTTSGTGISPGTNGNGAPSSSCGGGGGGFYTSGGNDLYYGFTGGAGFRQGGAGGVAVAPYASGYGYQPGGFGGGGPADYIGSCNIIAGAGGGYSGGSGYTGSYLQYGAAGGSFNGGTNQSNTAGFQTGHGQVIITYAAPVTGVPPVVSVSSGSVCPGASYTITASGALTYTYSGGSNIVSPIVSTNYSVTGSDASGCVSAPAISSVAALASPTLVVSAASPSICPGISTNLTVNGANTYTWTSPSSNLNVVAVNPSVTTVYTVSGTGATICNGIKTFTLFVYPSPTLVATPASPTVCNLAPITFTAAGANTYTWNNTNAIAGNTVVLTPTNSPTYTLTGASVNGCLSTTTVAVVTNSLPVMAITPSSATVCAFSAANFTASGAITYTWSYANATTATLSAVQGVNTTYSVTGTNTLGCNGTATVAVITTPLPTVSISPSLTTVCANSQLTLTASGAVTYSWSNNSTTTTAVVSPSAPSQYSVVGTDALGCKSNGFAVALTNALPVISVSPSTQTVCALTATTFSASGAGTFTWSNGNTGSTATITPTATAIYTVNGTDANTGCIGTQTVTLVANPLPSLSITPPSASVCLGAQASITASSSASGVSYSWSNGTSGPAIAVTPTVNTSYTVTATDALGCVSNQIVPVVVNALPAVAISPVEATICVNEVATINASGASTYTWVPGNVVANVFTVSPTATTFYTVTGMNANNCTKDVTFIVKVSACTGIETRNGVALNVSIYPNPTSGVFTAQFGFEGLKNITVVNTLGALIMQTSTVKDSEIFDLSGFAKGVYFVKINTKQASGNYKIVLE